MMTQLPIRNIYVVWLNVCSSWKHNMSWTSETWNLYVWITCITWASINRELNHGGRINHNGWKNSPNWWLDQTGSIGRISILPLFLFFFVGCFWVFFFYFFSKPIREGSEGYQRPRGSSYLGQYNWGRDLCVPVPALDIGDLKFYYFNLLDLHVCYWCWTVVCQISSIKYVCMNENDKRWLTFFSDTHPETSVFVHINSESLIFHSW